MAVSFPGIGSGLDVNGLLDALKKQSTARNQFTESRISQIESETESLAKLKSSLGTVSSKLDSLRTVNGGAASVKSVTSSTPTVATASIGSGAQSGSYNLDVQSLASKASGSFARTFSSGSGFIISDPGNAGTVEFAVGSGDNATTFNVEVNETTTAQDFVNQFNSASGGKASASLIKLADNSYKISFSSASSGTDQGTINISADPQLSGGDALGASSVSQATNAIVNVAGLGTIERSTNSISDLVPGVTVNLASTGTTTISIQNDAGSSLKKAEEIVSAINSLIEFANKEDKVTVSSRGGKNINSFGSLSKTGVDEAALGAIKSAISSARSTDGSTSLASLGISTSRDGSLSIDKDKFTAAFNANPEAANQALTSLADKLSGVEGEIQKFTGFQREIDLAVKANDQEIKHAQTSIARVESNANKQIENLQKRFSGLDKAIASANQAASALSGLLKF